MGKATDSFFSFSQVAPHPLLSPNRPRRPPVPSSSYCNVNKIGAGNVAVWWKSACSMGSWHEKNSASAQISVSIIMSPIYSENELIV